MDIKSPTGEGRNLYTYSASGVKLRTVHLNSTNTGYTPVLGSTSGDANFDKRITTDYVGNKIYENDKLKRILVDGGYIEYDMYHFHMTDHLGNSYVVAKQNEGVAQRNHYYPFGMTFADSFNPDAQPYKYNGKEFEKSHRLNMYDYSARHYDPALGRFTTVDPHAENYYSWSPYHYAANNPIRIIDPTGMDWVMRVVDGVTEYYYDRDIRSQEDANSKYGSNNFVMHLSSGSSMTRYNANGEMTAQFTFFNDGSSSNENGAVIDVHGNLMPDDKIIYGNDFTIFGTSDNSVNAETLHKIYLAQVIQEETIL